MRVNSGLTNTIILDLAINASGHIFAGAFEGGVFRSTNDGDSWTAVNTGLTNTNVAALTIEAGGYVFAGTYGGGVFRSVESTGVGSAVAEQTAAAQGVPEDFVLQQNFPNPFGMETRFGASGRSETAIHFGLPARSLVTIKIFDLAGHEVATLLDHADLLPGRHQRTWAGLDAQGRPVSNGIYFCQFIAGSFVRTIKMMIYR
jgi:hypothetical protein